MKDKTKKMWDNAQARWQGDLEDRGYPESESSKGQRQITAHVRLFKNMFSVYLEHLDEVELTEVKE